MSQVKTSGQCDSNLHHNWVNSKSLAAALHFVNQTPIDWFSKLIPTVETSTFGTEAIASRTATDQIIDLRLTLRYMGVPLGRSVLFGDNQSFIKNSTVPHSKLKKRHLALAYHRVRSAIAARILDYYYIPSEENPADICSKHWGYQQIWKVLKPILFWPGDTFRIYRPTLLA